MTHEFTPNSTRITRVGWDSSFQELVIEFKKGGTYLYSEVPADVYSLLASAPSVGKAFDEHVKGKYNFKKI